MDDTDRKLIALLRDNARASIASLAKALRVARGTVSNRLARLEKSGVIVGYTLRLRPQVEEQHIRTLRGDPAVSALYTTNGRWDIVVELRADSLEAFDRVLARIRLVEGISSTETSLLLSTYKL